jgi:hypothetical protein
VSRSRFFVWLSEPQRGVECSSMEQCHEVIEEERTSVPDGSLFQVSRLVGKQSYPLELWSKSKSKLVNKTPVVFVDAVELTRLMNERVDDILDWSATRRGDDSAYTSEEANRDRVRYEGEILEHANRNAAMIEKAVLAIPSWSGSAVLVRARPTYSMGKDSFMTDEGETSDNFSVDVYKATTETGIPGFTPFGNGAVEDVIDAGDRDFFDDPELENDYFSLVNELRNPGKSKKDQDKIATLYTARPVKDRALYEGAVEIPSNIFLTTSYDEAEGYNVEFGGTRDIWKIWVRKKYLVMTLDASRIKNYQTFSMTGRVPVERTELA